MNKDMENTFNQMAELGGSDERLGQNTAPVINAPLLPKDTRPAPAATDTGLVTVAWNCTYPSYGHFTLKEHEAKQAIEEGAAVKALCYCSQAVELLAAERAESDRLRKLFKTQSDVHSKHVKELITQHEREREIYGQAAQDFRERAEKAEAKLGTANALITCCCGDPVDAHDMGSGHSPVDQYHYTMMQLEAKLAAAEKVKDAMRKAAVDYCWQRYKSRAPMNLKDPAVFTSHEWEKIGEAMDAAARAVLGGKPS